MCKGKMTAVPTTTTKDGDVYDEMKKKCMVPFPHLKDIHTYEPTTFLYNPGESHPQKIKKQDWIRVFRMALPEFTKRAKMDDKVEDAELKSEVFREQFEKYLNDLNENEDENKCAFSILYCSYFSSASCGVASFGKCLNANWRKVNAPDGSSIW